MGWESTEAWLGTIDWGTAPDWLAAIGTVGAVVFALWSTRRESRRHREQERLERLREERLEAAQRRASVEPVSMEIESRQYERRGDEDGEPVPMTRYLITVHNSSALPIYDLKLNAISDIVEEVATKKVLPSNQVFKSIKKYSGEHISPEFFLRFKDSRSNRWEICDTGDLFDHSGNANLRVRLGKPIHVPADPRERRRWERKRARERRRWERKRARAR